jgi:chitin disaccharide deacetylase
MRLHIILLVVLGISGTQLLGQTKSVAERLGYPANAKLLIIHADDLAVAHSVDEASFDALDKGAVTSASTMVPCPWIAEVAAYAKAHVDRDLGLHLTLTSEWKTYRWGPVAPSDQVPSLIDPAGTLWSDTPLIAQHAKPEDAEREIRAQVERAMSLGIRPTHLDTHMASVFATPQIFAVYAKVAHSYHLPFLVVRVPGMDNRFLSALSADDVVLDSVVIANPSVAADGWTGFYMNAIQNLKPGLTEMIVHLGHDDDELQAITVDHPDYGAAWRQRDYNWVTSPEFKSALKANQVTLVKWKDFSKLVNQP